MKKLLIAILLFILGAAVHYPSTSHQFVLDDTIHIEENTKIRSRDNIEGILSTPVYPGNLYRPAVILSYLTTYEHYKLDPYYYHLTNVLLHALCSVVVFYLIGFFFTPYFSFFVGLLFAVHPITSEVVANVSGRAEILAALFGLSSLLFFLAGDSKKLPSLITLPIGTLFLVAALLSKESALVIPLLYILLRTYYAERSPISSAALPLVSFAVAIPVYLYLRFEYLDIQTLSIPYIDNPLAHMNVFDRIGKATYLLGKYLSLLFFPTAMSADYSYAHLTVEAIGFTTTEWKISSFLIAITILSAISYLWRKDEIPFFSMWFLLSFAVTANLFLPIGTIFAERLAYLPSIGFAGCLVTLCFVIVRSRLKEILLLALALVFSYQTYIEEEKWENNETLFAHQIKTTPDSVRVRYNYGIALRNKGNFEEAKKHFQEALDLYNTYPEAAYGMATIAVHESDISGAEQWLLQSLQMNPHYIPSYTMLGRITLVKGDAKKAKSYFFEAYKRDKRNEEALLGLFAVAITQKDIKMSTVWEKRLRLLPSTHREYLRLKKTFLEQQNATLS